MTKFIFLFFAFSLSTSYAQENNIFERLSALKDNKDATWYNIDDYSVKDENTNYSFDEKGFKKMYKKYKISDNESKTKKTSIKINHFFRNKKR